MILKYTEESTFTNGILCHLKNVIKFYAGGDSNSFTYRNDPNGLICNNQGINFYFKECINNSYLEIRFDPYSAKLNNYAILGRYFDYSADVMQSFQILGQTKNAEWVVLSEIKEKPLQIKTAFEYPCEKFVWINAIRIRNIGEVVDLTYEWCKFCNTFGGI